MSKRQSLWAKEWPRVGFYGSLLALCTTLTLPVLTDVFGDSFRLFNLGLAILLLSLSGKIHKRELALAWLAAIVCWPTEVYYDNDFIFTLVPQIGLLRLAWGERIGLNQLWKSLGDARYLIALYFIFGGFSSLSGNAESLWLIGHEALIFVMAMAIWSAMWIRSNAMLWIFGAASIGASLVLIYVLFLSPFDGKAATYPIYNNGNYFSGLLSLLLPFVAWLSFFLRGKWRWLAVVVLLGTTVALVVLQSRGAWLGLAGGLGLGLILYVKRPGLRLALMAFGLSALALFFVYGQQQKSNGIPENGWEQLLSIADTESNFSNRERLMRWKAAWRMGMDNPGFGVGPGNYIREFKYYLKTTEEVEQISYWEGWNGYGHSEYLTRFAERGFLGGLTFLALLGWLIYRAFARVRNEEVTRIWGAVSLAALGTWMVHGLFNDLSLDHRVLLLVFLLMVAFLEKRSSSEQGSTESD